MNKPLRILWVTTNTFETAYSLKRMYKGIPAVVIKNAIESGVNNFEDLYKAWHEHNVQCAKNKAEARKSSVQHMRHWTLDSVKRDTRFYDK